MRYIFISLIAVVMMINPAKAQKHSVKITPLRMTYSRISGTYEYMLKDNISLGIMGFYSYPGNNYSLNVKYEGFKVAPVFRYYPLKNAPQKFYLESQLIYGRFQHLFIYEGPEYFVEESGYTYDEERQMKTFNTAGAAFHLGWQWILFKFVSVDLNFGIQYLPIPVSDHIYVDGEKYYLDEKNPDKHEIRFPRAWYLFGPGSVLNGNIAVGIAF